jgi:RNA polymerase sigma factor (sigma-70 family)
MAVTTHVGLAAAPDDSALINLVLSGHAECFGVLMARHLAAVRGRIRRMTRSVSDGDDIMQEVQLKIWRRLGSFRSESSFRTWMTRVAINEAFQFYRKAKRHPFVHDCTELLELTSPSESPLQACVRGELTEKLKAAVERLPVKDKQVVVRRCVSIKMRHTA